METFWGLNSTAWTAIYSLLTAGLFAVAIITACFAYGQWKTANLHAEELRKAQLEAMRPYVTVTVELGLTSMQLIDLVIRNIGQRPAERVRIEIIPPLIRANEMDQVDLQMKNMRLLNKPVAIIPPGQVIRAFYDNQLDRVERDDLSTEHVSRVSYSDSSGGTYAEQFMLDLNAFKGLSQTKVGTVHTISNSLERIRKTLSDSKLLNQGTLDVQAATELRSERELRTTFEDYERRKAHLALMRKIQPTSPSISTFEASLAATEDAMRRHDEYSAIAPILKRLRQLKWGAAWVRRNWSKRS